MYIETFKRRKQEPAAATERYGRDCFRGVSSVGCAQSASITHTEGTIPERERDKGASIERERELYDV